MSEGPSSAPAAAGGGAGEVPGSAPRGIARELVARLLGVGALFAVILGAFSPGSLDTLLLLHLECLVLLGLLVLGGFVTRSPLTAFMALLAHVFVVPLILLFVGGSWVLVVLMYAGGPAEAGASTGEPLADATWRIFEGDVLGGLSELASQLGPSALWLLVGLTVYHAATAALLHVRARRRAAQEATAEEARDDGEDHVAVVLFGRTLTLSGALLLASVVVTIPFAAAVLDADEAAWPSYLVVIGVRLGVEAWRVHLDRRPSQDARTARPPR